MPIAIPLQGKSAVTAVSFLLVLSLYVANLSHPRCETDYRTTRITGGTDRGIPASSLSLTFTLEKPQYLWI